MLLAYLISGLAVMGFMLLRFSGPEKRADYLNTLAIAHSAIYLILTVIALVYLPQPSFFFNRYLMVDPLSVYEVLIACGIFLLASFYARGYVRRLVQSGEIEVRQLRLFYAAYNLLLIVVVFAFYCNNMAFILDTAGADDDSFGGTDCDAERQGKYCRCPEICLYRLNGDAIFHHRSDYSFCPDQTGDR